MRSSLVALPLFGAAVAGLAGCGGGSSPTATATASTSETTITAQTLTTANITGPTLNVAQLGFRMTFPAQLGTVNYWIDNTGAGQVTENNGVSARFVATVNLYTSLYAANCAPLTGTTATSTSTTTGTAAPQATQNLIEAQILVYDNTTASSLGPEGGAPEQWVRAGPHLLGFREVPGFVSCGAAQFELDLPLLRAMFSTARAD
jgi:hypothetical protein